ncbi:unnamed protein product [Paramecium octaurelia]|uniref:DUF4378 domain-containing protein n=1 Tax=Paramecium octaurelia TaxID=43137 RepID=A0A8S1U9A7_PAROT|nr:unnamed protein product [Paramecium octaurelia]
MNTYSSVKSIESQILGRRIQEPNVAVMFCKHQPNQKHHSPESFLDQFVNLKLVEPQKILQKQKPPQGQQGKGIANTVQLLKPAQCSISVKKQTKRTISPKKKKAQTVDCVQMSKPKSQQQRREQMGLGELNDKQIKQRSKKIKQKEKTTEQPLKKKPYEPNTKLQSYIIQKKTLIYNNYMQQQLMVEMEKQRKLENLAQLNQSVKDIFKKCKTQENTNLQPSKAIVKRRKVEAQKENAQQNNRQIKNQNKTKQLQQKFDDISHRYQQIQDVRYNDLNNVEQCIFEMDEEDDQYSAVSDNQMVQLALQELKKIKPTEYLINKVKYIIENQNNIDLDFITEQDYQVIQYHLMNQAATKLQSVWRGVYVRKQILYELQNMMEEEYDNISHEDLSKTYQRKQFQQEFIGNISNSNSKGVQDSNVSASNKIENRSLQDLNFNQDQLAHKYGQIKQHFYSEEDQAMDIKLSDQISELIMIQQPNSPIEQTEDFSIQFGQIGKRNCLEQIDSFVRNEDEKTNSLSQSVVQQIQQELDSWNCQIDTLFQQSNDGDTISKVKQQISQTVIKIVNSHLKKSREVKQLNESANDEKIRNQYEANNEKHFNDTIKRLKKSREFGAEQQLYSSRETEQNINNFSLESQLKLKESELLNMREQAINLRYFSELKKVKQDSNKKQELDLWLEKEKEDLRSTKQAIEISRIREAQTIQKIQRDLQIASKIDENNPKIQNFKKFVDEQLLETSSFVNESKIIDNQTTKQENEYQEQIDLNIKNENANNDNSNETFHHINYITNSILDQVVNNLSQELFSNKTEFKLVMSLLTNEYSNGESKTSTQYIQEYIKSLFDFILLNNSEDLIRNLNIPYGFRPLRRIQLMHGYDVDDEIQNSDQRSTQIAFPIDQSVFAKFEQQRFEMNCNRNGYQKDNEYYFENVHNKAIFDACNEALNYQRQYYLNQGQPYPWEQLEYQAIIQKDKLSTILRNMEDKVLNWSKTLGGFLPIENTYHIPVEKQEVLEEKNSQLTISQLHRFEKKPFLDSQLQEQMQENITSIRDERIYKLLIQDIKENEFRWYLAEDDRAEFLMEFSDVIFEQLVEEIVSEQLLQ